MRRIITGYYVDPDVERLGLEGSTARESIGLLRQSERSASSWAATTWTTCWGEPLFEPAFDPRPFVPQIEPHIAEVRGAFEAHQRSRRRVDELLERKKKAVRRQRRLSGNSRANASGE